MAKNKVSEWSSTPANNTDIGNINIAEGCAPSGINNAIRELMAQVKDMQAGTDGDSFTVGGNLSVTGTSTLTGAATLSGALSVGGNLSVTGTTTLTGTATAPTPTSSDNSTKIATTAFVKSATSGGVTSVDGRTGAVVTLVSGTAATASGSSVDFTGIPSWAKRITVMIVGVSTTSGGTMRIRVGTSSGLVTTGYAGGIMNNTTAPVNEATNLASSPSGIGGSSLTDGATVINGTYTICNVTGNTWAAFGSVHRTGDSIANYSNGNIALSGVLDRVSVVATTGTFDAGTINILYE